ncbi:hypothetical protein DIPPA_14995 [Diplonema papillatum]|nr:hypothetical protein DIPPA_14995 [Diplonema papillatum]KAJ9452060.1 hypothetical protein DIPPA_14995 [Diplonema papillatum]|eukprot:gene14691-22472_t
MAVVGTVRRWMRSYGFAEAESGEVVYFHKTLLPEGYKLKVGEVLFFDMEPVDGHGGRLRGINISGPAIVPNTEQPTKEEEEAEKKAWEAFKLQKIAPLSDTGPKPGRRAGAPKAAGGGGRGGGGAPEKRIDVADGQAYEKADFIACYGGEVEWNRSKPVGRGSGGKPAGRGGGGKAAPAAARSSRRAPPYSARPHGRGAGGRPRR